MRIIEEVKKMVIAVYCEGYYKATSGAIATWSWAGLDKDGKNVESRSGCVGRGDGMSAFVAGYTAIIEALKWIHKNQRQTPAVIYSDMELVVNQILGQMKCKDKKLRPLYEEAVRLKAATKVELRWTPGALNKQAKSLSRAKYHEELARGGWR